LIDFDNEREGKQMTTIHTGDKTSGCEECAVNDYIGEILEMLGMEESENAPEALKAWVRNSPVYYQWSEWANWCDDFEEAWVGSHSSTAEFAELLADETVTPDLPEIAQIYFDYQKWERDLFMGDYWASDRDANGDIHIFRAH
jgi:antirestriction protein